MSEKHSVLIICHSAAGQMYLGVLLNRIWYSPILVRTVEEGIRFAQRTEFSLILFDGDIPQTELQPALALLRTDPALKELPLVVFISDSSLQESLVNQGCSAVLVKPLDLTILYGVLHRLSGQPRNAPRIAVKIKVEILEGTPEKTLTCVNISEGGMYLRTMNPLPEGTCLHLKFNLPHDNQSIDLIAEVVRTLKLDGQLTSDPGMGLHFIDMQEDVLIRIRNFVEWEMTGDLEWEATL
ncbi:MAG: PilZ domain-containing protein [Nitrospirota bacterium]